MKMSFYDSCIHGDLKQAKEIYLKGGVTPNWVDHTFQIVCMRDRLDVVIWLWSLGCVHHNISWCIDWTHYYNSPRTLFWFLFLEVKIPKMQPSLLIKAIKVNVFETVQMSLIENYTKLIIS